MNEKKTRSVRGQGVVDSSFSLAAPPIALLFWVSIGSVLPYFSSMIQVGSQLSQEIVQREMQDNFPQIWRSLFSFSIPKQWKLCCLPSNLLNMDSIKYLLRVYETRMELLRAVIVGAGYYFVIASCC
ncbi:uncharacterized protein LOC121050603 [Rosa chinensis]|uniref:uncharacterized protein LOC121050603 n=1 Tax=Rosa chinensis TaxID=74649 RepID=UPI001AD938E2|nr:uncharacterized protein LOC121050603 [Rosa chinensis]